MADKNKGNGFLAAILGGLVAAAALAFLLTGGELGGKKSVEGDHDLAPVASAERQK
jgi:hypothetical protein